MTSWLKLGYFNAQREEDGYWQSVSWVSDSPGRASSRWAGRRRRPRRGAEYPTWGPQYAVGDFLVMYLTGVGICPAILEVTKAPRWDPDEVDDAWAGEGDRWGVVTEVKCRWDLPNDDAPSLEDIGVFGSSVSRKGHIHLEDWQFEEALRLIGGAGSQRRSPVREGLGNPTLVPVEERHQEGFDVTTRAEVTRAERREARLVEDYVAHIRRSGDAVSRCRMPIPGGHAIYCDVFNETRQQLIEAKTLASRGAIRMAIGQLADYSRFLPQAVTAVLLEARPAPDLMDLLEAQEIVAIWRSGVGFHDTAGGRFV
jgi:hypothetical protein